MVRIIHASFLLAAFIVVAAAAMFYTSLSQHRDVAIRLYEINEIFDAVHRIREDYIRAEKAAYRHATSGEDAALVERQQLLTNVEADIASLSEYLQDDVGQSLRLQQLAAAFTTLQSAPSTPLLIDPTDSDPLVLWQQRRDFFDVISLILSSVLQDSETLDHSAREYFRIALVQIASLIAISLLLILAAYLFALRQVRTRQRAETLLHEKTLFQNAVLASTRKAIITTDRQGIIQSFNVGAEATLGYRAEEVIGRARPGQFHDPHELRARADVLSVEQGVPVDPSFDVLIANVHGDQDDEQEWSYIRKDGSSLPVLLSVSALRTDQGEAIGYLGIAVDITKQKQTQAQLSQARADAEDAARVKSAFLTTMSHEIRTPMNGVLGMVEVLTHSPLTDHQNEIVKIIRDSARILLRLIDDILDFSKIEAGRIELEKEPVCIRELAEGVCSALLPMATNKEVELRVFVSPAIPERVLADDVRLRQVLYNLVGNAIKFTGEQPGRPGRVQLRAEIAQIEPLSIVFQVIDNGIGIAPERVEGLFSPFTQAEASTTRRFGGTGLGLAICKRIVELSEGEIQVESALGKGTTVTVTLPFEAAAAPLHSDMVDLTGLECIVVENKLMNTADLVAYLTPHGARVSSAVDLDEAVSLVNNMSAAAEVVVIHDNGDQSTLKSGRVRPVLLTHNSKHQARIRSQDVVSIDVDAMPRHSFVRAVAVAAGRLAPDNPHNTVQAEPALSVKRPSVSEARAQGRLILVAEDDVINQKVILHQLDQLGYAAEIASTGAQALDMWRAGRHALLLTDLNMPELDGCGLTSAIRAEEAPGSHLPILALSANALRGETAHMLCSGIDGNLTKPVSLKALEEALETWLPPNNNHTGADAIITDEGLTTANATVVDLNILKALVGDDQKIVHELLTEFQSVAGRQANELRQAYEAGDTALISATAHKLKSSSRSIGALQLGDACVELENASKRNDNDSLRLCMHSFDAALAAVAGTLNGLLAKRPRHE